MLCIIRGRARAWVGAVILQTSLNRSRREEMALLSVAVFARRWPFMLFVLVSALLCFTFVLFCLPTATPHEALPLPFLLITFCLVVYAGEWSDILRARLAAVGLDVYKRQEMGKTLEIDDSKGFFFATVQGLNIKSEIVSTAPAA